MTSVLLAEDDHDIRQLASVLLELAGHDVQQAASVGEALDRLAADPQIEVLLLDLRLPDGSGWDVMAHLAGSGRIIGLRVIVFSAQIEPRDHERARKAGAAGYLTKPFTEADLLAAISDPSVTMTDPWTPSSEPSR